MWARVRKYSKAYKALEGYGFRGDVVKAALKKLLKMYDDKWEFIENENYKVLVHFILDNQQQNEEGKCAKKEAPYKSSDKTKRLYTTRQQRKPAFSLPKPCLGETSSRKAHPNDVVLLSDSSSEESQPAVRGTPQKCQEEKALIHESKAVKSVKIAAPSHEKTEAVELPTKRIYRRNQKKQALLETFPSGKPHPNDADMLSDSSFEELQLPLRRTPLKRLKEAASILESQGLKSEDVECPTKRLYTRQQENQASPFSKYCLETTPSRSQHPNDDDDDLLSGFEESQELERTCRIHPEVETLICESKGVKSKIKEAPSYDKTEVYGDTGKKLNCFQVSNPSELNLKAGQKNHSSPGIVKPYVHMDDITRGEERMKISLENGGNVDDFPAFSYILRNLVYKNACVKFSLNRISEEDCCSHCFGDCLTSPKPCFCTNETCGDFAYTTTGLVKEYFLEECITLKQKSKGHHYFYCIECPLESSKKKSSVACNGHLPRNFIKECWSKCGCNKSCGNRIVQRGITVNLQVFMTPEGKGWGVRTLEDLPRGTFVCEYVGEIVTNTELYERNVQKASRKHIYPVILDAGWGSKSILKDEETLYLDSTDYGNVARFINHRCSDASLIDIPVEVETPDHHYYHVALFTTRTIAAMEELTWDYGFNFEELDHPVKAFKCLCGSLFCRGGNL